MATTTRETARDAVSKNNNPSTELTYKFGLPPSEDFEGIEYPARAANLSKGDIYGVKPCCDTWEQFLFQSIGQKILSNPRFSQYLNKRSIDCIEKKTGARYNPTSECIDPMTINPTTNTDSEGNLILSGNTEYASNWTVVIIFTPTGVIQPGAILINRVETFDGTLIPEINIGQPPEGQIYSITETFTDNTNGCVYCFTIHNVVLSESDASESTTPIEIPLFTSGDCPEYTAGNIDQNARFIDCNGVENDLVLSGIVLDELTLDVTLFSIGQVIKLAYTAGDVCFRLDSFTSDVTTNPPPLVTDDPYTNIETACAECVESICVPLDPFLVNLRIVSDTPNNQVVVTNNTTEVWDAIHIELYPLDGLGAATIYDSGVLNPAGFVSDPLIAVDAADLYSYLIIITIGACTYCASTGEGVVSHIPIDGAGIGAGVGNTDCV